MELCRTGALSAHGEDSLQNCLVVDCPQLRLHFQRGLHQLRASQWRESFYANVDYGAFGWSLVSRFALELGYQHRYAPIASGVIGQNDNELQVMLLSTAPIRRFHHRAQ